MTTQLNEKQRKLLEEILESNPHIDREVILDQIDAYRALDRSGLRKESLLPRGPYSGGRLREMSPRVYTAFTERENHS